MEVSSPDGSRWETVDALVDTGASYSQVPGSLPQRLGIVPTDTVEAVLADGRVVEDLAPKSECGLTGWKLLRGSPSAPRMLRR